MTGARLADLDVELARVRTAYARARRLALAAVLAASAVGLWLTTWAAPWIGALLATGTAAGAGAFTFALRRRWLGPLRRAAAVAEAFRSGVRCDEDAWIEAGDVGRVRRQTADAAPGDPWSGYQRQRLRARAAIAEGDPASAAEECARLEGLTDRSDRRMEAGTAVTAALRALVFGGDPLAVLASADLPGRPAAGRQWPARRIAVAVALVVAAVGIASVLLPRGPDAGVSGLPGRILPGAADPATLRAATDLVAIALARGEASPPEPLTKQAQFDSQPGDNMLWWFPDGQLTATGVPPGDEVVEVLVPLGDYLTIHSPVVFLWVGPAGGGADHLVRVAVDEGSLRQVSDLLVQP